MHMHTRTHARTRTHTHTHTTHSDTVSRSGVFCSFISATECCKTEGIVDLFQVVKALRIQKPGSVLTVEQYRFIFDLMIMYLESFSIYSNFK